MYFSRIRISGRIFGPGSITKTHIDIEIVKRKSQMNAKNKIYINNY